MVGGNGRVGGSAARHIFILDKSEGGVELILGGRSQSSFESSKARIMSQLQDASLAVPQISFQSLDLNSSPTTLARAIETCGAHAVVHTAGPFQQRTQPTLMEASIRAGVPYVDGTYANCVGLVRPNCRMPSYEML